MAPCGLIQLALDHRDTLPIERIEQAAPRLGEVAVQRDAFAVDAHPALRRLLSQPAVRELRDDPTIPPQHKESFSGAVHPPLQQHWKRGVGERADRLLALVRRIHELDTKAPAPNNGAMRLENRG